MALDRQSIEKKDFPIGRRGYDPDAVDAHLARIAEEVAGLEAEPAAAPTLASTAGGRIQAIVDAAEQTAADIEKQAKDEARTVRREAEQDARRERESAAADAAQAREQAASESREHVARVMEGTSAMRKRLEAMEGELGSVLEALKTSTARVEADLELLQASVDELRGSQAAAVAAAPHESTPPPAPAAEAPTEIVEPEPLPELEPQPEPEPVADAASSGPDEVEGARLVALNMALNGTPRAETEQYLQENFSLEDRDGLLDEVYATVGE